MQNRIQVGLLALAAGISFTLMPSAAETYKWTDAEGKVHYSDQPPPSNVKNPTTVTPRKKTSRSAPAQEGDPKPADARPTPAAAKTTQELDAEFKQRQVEAAEQEAAQKKAAQEAESKKKSCEQAKASVARLTSGGRIARANDKGETEYLDDAQITAELARAREIQDSWCK
jgi:type IV secretory pathway VirB10-like protein